VFGISFAPEELLKRNRLANNWNEEA